MFVYLEDKRALYKVGLERQLPQVPLKGPSITAITLITLGVKMFGIGIHEVKFVLIQYSSDVNYLN